MKKRKKYALPLLAETEKKRFHRLLHERPIPYPDRPQTQKSSRTRPIRRP